MLSEKEIFRQKFREQFNCNFDDICDAVQADKVKKKTEEL